MSIDSRMIGLSSACRCTSVSIASGSALGEEAAALDRRQLRRIAEHQQRHAERHQVAAEFGVDHRAFVDDDQRGLRRRRVVPQIEARHLLAALARLVDQAVDGGGALAALAAHHQRGLAGEGREQHLAVDRLGEVAGERGLAGAGIAEQPEDLRRAALPGLGLEPGRDRLERGILMRGEDGHGLPGGITAAPYIKNKERTRVFASCIVSLLILCWRHGFVVSRRMTPDRPSGFSAVRLPRGRRSAERRHFAVPASALSGFGGRALSGERVAFRRSAAAILGLGTVLPGLGRPALHRPYRGAFAPLVLSRPALDMGSPP